MKPSIVIPVSIFLSHLILCIGYEISLQERKDLLPLFWKFPKDRPYNYFDNVSVIPHSFLPIQTSVIPEAKGLWVLRYKDFSGPPRVYADDKDTSVAIISYSTPAQLFNELKIKAIIYGDSELNLVLQAGSSKLEKIHLASNSKNCHDSSDSKNDGGVLRWITYHVQTTPSGHLRLETSIHNPHSFVIIDEITASYPEDNKSINKISSEETVEENKNYRLHCKLE